MNETMGGGSSSHVVSGRSPRAASAIVQEIGTVPSLQILQALRAEGALLRDYERQGKPAPPPEHPVRQAVRACFYPESSERWKAAVLTRGLALIRQNLVWLSELV